MAPLHSACIRVTAIDSMDITKYILDYRDSAFLVGDYGTYRAQLSRRLRIVRKKLGRATAKNAKYTSKAPVTAEEIESDIEYLHLLLLTSERAWAHAMHMKATHAEDTANKNISGSTRQHIISRLHKAACGAEDIAQRLSDQQASGANDTDLLEANAYAFTLRGAEEFEKQAEGVRSNEVSAQRWAPCLAKYSVARVIYSTLYSATKRDLFKEVLAGTIDPSLRYAAYQHRIPRTVGVPSVAQQFFPKDRIDLKQAVEKLDPSALQEEAQTAESSTTITWRSRTANIRDAAIGQALIIVEAASAQLSESLRSLSSTKDRANAYDDVLIASQDAGDATRRAIEELEKEGVNEGDPRMQDLRVTYLVVNYDLVAFRVGRNRVLIGADDGLTYAATHQQKPRQPRKDGKEWVERDEPTGRKLARLRERVALYDAILQSIDSIKELRGAVRNAAFIAELDGQRAYFQSLKCLSLSHSHAFLSAPKQALALCSRALSLASQAASAPRPPATPSDAPKLIVSEEQAQLLKQNLESLTSHYRGLVALSQLISNPEIASKTQLTNAAPVVERLNEYPASGSVDLANLVTWPPKLKPVPVKPLFLDVAWNYIEYPGRRAQVQAQAPAQPSTDEKKAAEEKPAKKGWFSFSR